MKKFIISLLIASVYYLFLTTPVFAQDCQAVYGGGQVCPIERKVAVNKTVMHPKTLQFIDNLTINDPRFAPNQIIPFQISVINSSKTTLPKVTVIDVLPQFTTFVSGPGNFNSTNQNLSFDVFQLQPDEIRTFTINAKALPLNGIQDQAIVCVTNNVFSQIDNQVAKDTAQVCIQKEAAQVVQQPGAALPGVSQVIPSEQIVTKGGKPVLPQIITQQTPPTGAEALALAVLTPMGLLGAWLRKKAY